MCISVVSRFTHCICILSFSLRVERRRSFSRSRAGEDSISMIFCRSSRVMAEVSPSLMFGRELTRLKLVSPSLSWLLPAWLGNEKQTQHTSLQSKGIVVPLVQA